MTARISILSQAELEKFMRETIDEAKKGLSQGGIPIGAVLIRDGRNEFRRVLQHAARVRTG